jgi:D-lactate dehydrogenase
MMRQPAGAPVLSALLADYDYDAVQTCAGDGTCEIACPVGINTGALMKRFRVAERTPAQNRVARGLAVHWSKLERGARAGLAVSGAATRIVGHGVLEGVTGALRRVVSHDLVPAWARAMPAAAVPLPATVREGAAAVYFSACVNRIFGAAPGRPAHPSLPEALVAVSARAGQPLWIPPDVAGHCCATVWHSKGYEEANTEAANRTVESLWRWTDGGALPVVCDASSCSFGLVSEIVPYLTAENRARHARLELFDSIAWVHDRLLPKLTVHRRVGSAVLHPSCSAQHLGLAKKLHAIAATLADEAVVPAAAACCGFAGDRGFLHPELTASATADEAAEVRLRDYDAYLGSNRTCEIGLLAATGQDYASFVFLLEAATRPPG